jgi:TonB-linked SusC/RagA family outer membrane protein
MPRKIALRFCALTLLSICMISFSFAQNSIKISGVVKDEAGKPLQGVTVQVNATKKVAITKPDGTFDVAVPSATTSLTISSVGYTDQVIALNNKTNLVVTLVSTASALQDVVVIGYGTQKKKNVTAAVANFDARNLDERPVARIDQALVGQMAGVTVKQTSGALGKGISIQVRGTGSITAGNEPLYVLDGFPFATSAPNSGGGYSYGNPLDNLNPNDIESIQVLKDASSAAIYGSRAANGVVLITTKKGKSGKPKISFNSYVGYMERSRKLDMLSADEWVVRAKEIINAQWVASASGRTASQTNDQRRVILGLAPGVVNTGLMYDDRWDLPGHPGLKYIDWQDEAFRKGMVNNHQVSASGGTDIVKYYVSGNYASTEGMVIGTDYTSYSGRANVEVTPSKNFKFGLNINPTYSVNNDPGVEGKDNILHQLISFSPVQEDTMGLFSNTGKNDQYRWSNSPNSPYAKLLNYKGVTARFRTISTVYADYTILKGLDFKTTVNVDNTDNTAKTYQPYVSLGSLAARNTSLNTLNTGSYNSYRKQTLVNENTLNYNTVINEKHNISLLAGQSFNQDKLERVTLNSTGGFNSAVITTLNAANGVTGNTNESRNVLLSYFGRVNYSFDDKYLLSASIRRDGSSRFGSNTKWGNFPSASIGWRAIDESFVKKLNVFSDLKLRASWGVSGNYNIGDYSSIPLLGVYNYSLNGVAANGQAPSSVTNPDLTWETAETYDGGIDIGVLHNRLTLSVDYYQRVNSNLLLNVPILAATGFSTYLSNAGKVQNKGLEFELTSRNLTGKFEWTTTANIAFNSNKVLELAGGQQQILIPSAFDINHSILKVGQPMYSIYVVKMLGTLTAADIANKVAQYGTESEGDPKYEDIDKNGVIDANDRQIVGQPTPKYTWGVTNTFKYKGFDLSVFVQGQNGGSIYSLLGRAISRTGQGFTDNAIGLYRDRWFSPTEPGAGLISKAYSTFGRIKNTDWLYSSDYFRIRNITLGYNMSNLVKIKNVQSARVYLTLENFFGKDKYYGGFNPESTNTDVSGNSSFPEAGDYGGLPIPRSLIFGLNFTF